MGDAQGEGCVAQFVLFLDENHCRNPHIIEVIAEYGAVCEKHLDHFEQGTEDVKWLPVVGERGWCLITTDSRIRRNKLEREAVRINGVRMFYFWRNQLSGSEMGQALKKALPKMEQMIQNQPPPFTVSIGRNGDLTLRDTFDETKGDG